MEARVYYKGGTVEAFAIPAFVGDSVTVTRQFDGTRTLNEIDTVKSITERFVVGEQGAWIDQVVEFSGFMPDDGSLVGEPPPMKVRRAFVADAGMLADVGRIELDGVPVYPGGEAGGADLPDPPGLY